MLLRKLLMLLFKPFNLAVWGLVAAAVLFLNIINPLGLIFVGTIITAVYMALKLKDGDFSKVLESNEKIYNIKQQNSKCERLADSSKNSTNSEKRYRVRQVLKNKDDIINCLLKDQESSLKQKIAQQAIELVTVYISLVENYYTRVRDVESSTLNEIQNRIETNKIKLESTENIELQMSLKNSIELDERLYERLNEEKQEIENLNGKLGYIESSINLLKQQILSNADEPLLDNVQDMINEAIALDTVLTERRKERNRV